MAIVSVSFLLSFWFSSIYAIAWMLTTVTIVILVIDLLMLYGSKKTIKARRLLPDRFSNSDQNPVPVTITNSYNFKTYIDVIDELPVQFQKRDFSYQVSLIPNEIHNFEYLVRPVDRGEYYFGHLNIYVSRSSHVFLYDFYFSFCTHTVFKS